MEELKAIWQGMKIAHWVMIAIQALSCIGIAGGRPVIAPPDLNREIVRESVREVVKEVPVVVREVEFVNRPKVPLVRWDSALLENGIQPLAKGVSDPLVWVMETNDKCGICKQNWNVVRAKLSQTHLGWTFGPGGQFQQQQVRFDHPIPVWRLMQGDTVLAEHVGMMTAEALSNRYIEEFDRVDKAAKAAVTSINGGTITREQWEQFKIVLKVIGPRGKITGTGTEQRIDLNGTPITIPANFTAQFSPGEGQALGDAFDVVFSPKASAKWGILTTSLSGIKYDGVDKVEILTYMSAFNPVLTIKD